MSHPLKFLRVLPIRLNCDIEVGQPTYLAGREPSLSSI